MFSIQFSGLVCLPDKAQAFQRQQRINRGNLRQFRGDELGVAAGGHHRQAFASKLVLEFQQQSANEAPITADGAPPILVVGGTGDPATPYEWAQSVHRQLTSSVLVTRQGVGHGSYLVSACATAATDAYLIDLTVPADGTVCPS